MSLVDGDQELVGTRSRSRWDTTVDWMEAHPVTCWYVVGAVIVGLALAIVISAFMAALGGLV